MTQDTQTEIESTTGASSAESAMLTDGLGLQIIFRFEKPYGIRDRGGYLLFFTELRKYEGQELRYNYELKKQQMLANFILGALMNA